MLKEDLKTYSSVRYGFKPKRSWGRTEIQRNINQTLGYIEKIKNGYYNLNFYEETDRINEAKEVLKMWEKRLADLG